MQIYLTSLRGKEYFAKEAEPEPVGAGCFWPLGAGAAPKKYQEPEPEPLKNLPAPQPCISLCCVWNHFQLGQYIALLYSFPPIIAKKCIYVVLKYDIFKALSPYLPLSKLTI